MKNKISIAIITKKREEDLEKCLDSICKQTQSNYEILLIDNDEKLSAKKVIKKNKYSKMKILYQYCKGTVPRCRNFAMEIAQTKYLCFVDDDCILKKNWLEEGQKKLVDKEIAYVMGKTLLLNPQNIFALSQYVNDNFWRNYTIQVCNSVNTSVNAYKNLQIFDTKNVIVNLSLMKKFNLKFDEHCQKDAFDNADFDFNFQLNQNNLKGIYCKKMLLSHRETNNFKRYVDRAYYRGYLAKYLNTKWNLSNQLADLRTNKFFPFLWKSIKETLEDPKKYSKYMTASFYKNILVTIVIKIFEFYYIRGYTANRKTNI
jgi:glycosyltransferase involved in cell wall biosynthesis